MLNKFSYSENLEIYREQYWEYTQWCQGVERMSNFFHILMHGDWINWHPHCTEGKIICALAWWVHDMKQESYANHIPLFIFPWICAQITVISIVSFTLIFHWTQEKMITSLFVWKLTLTPLTSCPQPPSSKKLIKLIKLELCSQNLKSSQLGNCQQI